MTTAAPISEVAGLSAEEQLSALLAHTLEVLEDRAARNSATPAKEAATTSDPSPEQTPDASDATASEGRHLLLARIFSLSTFETGVLLLCLAGELHPEAADLCAATHSDTRLRYPTFQLALSILPDPHWTALLPQSPLRRWSLVELGAGDAFLTSQLTLAEPVLHFLMGAPALDERLLPLLEPIAPPEVLPSCYRPQAEKLTALLAESRQQAVVAHLSGSATGGKRAVAALAAASLGTRLYSLDAAHWPAVRKDRELIQHMIERDAALLGFALLVDLEHAAPAEAEAAAQLADTFAGVALLCGDPVPVLRRSRVERILLDRPDPASQQALWNLALGDAAASCNGHVERVSTQFSFDYKEILRTGDSVRRRIESAPAFGPSAGDQLLASCRAGARGALDVLAQRIPPRAGWNDIVLPETGLESLHAIAAQVRQQGKVLERWGFAAQTSRGLGITALFAGASGTGKTLAAEVLAHELGLDLYRIDLSQVVSKYIGETEKNLRARLRRGREQRRHPALRRGRRPLRQAAARSRTATTATPTSRSATCCSAWRPIAAWPSSPPTCARPRPAFLRRIRFVVSFPFPDAAPAPQIWRAGPSRLRRPPSDLDFAKLSRLNVAGGNIRNIALNAAFLAADLDQPVRMEHLLAAARRECAKIDRPLTATETGGWV